MIEIAGTGRTAFSPPFSPDVYMQNLTPQIVNVENAVMSLAVEVQKITTSEL